MLGGSLEENVLTALCWSDTLAPHIAISLRPGDFSINVYRRIAGAAFDFLESHHRPTKAHIGDLLEHDIKRGPDGKFTAEVIEQMARLAPSLNEEFVRNSLDRFIETQRLINAVNSASELLHDGDLEQAREILRAPNLLPQDTSPGVWLRNSEEWLRFLSRGSEAERFSSGVDVLDERGVMPARGELMILLAATNMGKSWFLINCGKHNVLGHRKNVLHITLENSLEMTLQRYTQSFLALTDRESKRLSIDKFQHYTDPSTPDDSERVRWEKSRDAKEFPPIQEIGKPELLERLKPYQSRGQLLVKHFPTGTLTIGMLSAYLDMLEQVEHFKPDLLLLDYLTMMHLDTRDIRISIGQLGRSLRGLAEIRNCALVTVLQANRQAVGRKWISGTHTAEDWSLVGTSDVFLTYNQTAHERELHVARILVDKARNAAAKWSVFLTQAYEIGQFCLDSVYMTGDMAAQLAEKVPEE